MTQRASTIVRQAARRFAAPVAARRQASTSMAIPAPHSKIAASSNSERLALSLFDRLWERYRERVSYVNVYEQIVAKNGATFFNDHIALRSLALQDPNLGISSISRLFEALGYRAAECYGFEDKHLGAIYYQHPHQQLPKLFISELRVCELSAEARAMVHETAAAQYENRLTDDLLAALRLVDSASAREQDALLTQAVDVLHQVPWSAPEKDVVEAIHKESQYGAWVLVHGNNVNHFTALINSHEVEALNDIEKTAAALAAAGVPMKDSIEGENGSNLRQTATTAVTIPSPMRSQGKEVLVTWPYAYFELAQRDPQPDGSRYEGFFSTQATNLFEMTKGK
eukprot:Tamp_12645.p1 GENE.Tamp_12645~~Tamp_12645.p1  ORF type:complete len:340 (+),score=64.64 Tamp_12645:1-1020(+)